jgi:hypothetical protein
VDLAPQIKDATAVIQHVTPLADAIANLFQTPTGWVAIPAFFFWLIVNKDFSHLFDILERKEKKRAEQLDLYVAKPELADSESLKVLSDLRDAHYFKIATGIYAEKKVRRALINLHNHTSHHINWRQIQRAFPYIEVKEDESIIIRRMTSFEAIGYWYNQIVGYFSLLFAAAIFTLFLFVTPRTFGNVSLGVIGGLIMIFFALFVFAQNWPLLAARKIQHELMTRAASVENNA